MYFKNKYKNILLTGPEYKKQLIISNKYKIDISQ